MAEEDLVVKITLQDELSRQAATAKKSVSSLAKEVEQARKDAEKSGDPSYYVGLQAKLDEERRAWARLEVARRKAGQDVKAVEQKTKAAAANMAGAWKRLQGVFKNPLFTAATVAGVALFGKRAVEAFAQAETSQLKLVEAYRKFDAIGSVPIESIRGLAKELQSLTGTDDDLLAAAAGTLARFELTGEAIQGLLPLVNDFAILTGRDVVEASESIGKALMGNARALKELGINFTSTGDRGKDLDIIMASLEAKVGGAGEAFGATAQGGLARANAAFGDLQEEIGAGLVPVLTTMLRVVEPATRVFSGLADPVKSVVIVIGALGAAALALGPRIAMMITGMKAAGIEATAMKTKMAAAGGFMTGPWGAALAVGAVALTYFMGEQAKASARVDEFAASIDSVTGKLNQTGVAKVAETLLGDISQEDWATLEGLGIRVEDVTAAVIGSAEGWAAYEARLQSLMADNRVGSGGVYDILGALRSNVSGLRKDVADGTRAWEIASKAQAVAAATGKDVAYTSGTVMAALQRATPVVGVYRDEIYSSSTATRALKTAQENAATASDRLTAGLQGVADEVARQEAMNGYQTALDEFIAAPSEETALAVAASMTSAAQSIKDPGDKAKFTKGAVDDIRKAAQNAGMKLNPELDAGLQRARGQAILLKSQIDAAVEARIVDITLRFSDGRTTYGGKGDGPRHGGYTDGWISGAGGPTSDYAPIWASRGEYVLRAGAAAALQAALGDAGMSQLNHADRSMPSFLGAPIPQISSATGGEPVLVPAGGPVINIGEIRADSGIDVQTEVLWAMRRADRIRRERG